MLKFIKMEHLSVCGLLYEDSFSMFVLVAAIDIVVKGELCRRRNFFGLIRLLYCYILPFGISLVLKQVQVYFVKALVDRMGNDGFCFF